MLDLCYNTQNILRRSAIRIEVTRSRRPFSPILRLRRIRTLSRTSCTANSLLSQMPVIPLFFCCQTIHRKELLRAS
jgi:hypothetical protein